MAYSAASSVFHCLCLLGLAERPSLTVVLCSSRREDGRLSGGQAGRQGPGPSVPAVWPGLFAEWDPGVLLGETEPRRPLGWELPFKMLLFRLLASY